MNLNVVFARLLVFALLYAVLHHLFGAPVWAAFANSLILAYVLVRNEVSE